MITILNTSILTCFGKFSYEPITVLEAQYLLRTNTWQSAIGHESTAKILSDLLQMEIPYNRIDYKQQPGEDAIVFKTLKRAHEGKILTELEIHELGFSFGLLKMIER